MSAGTGSRRAFGAIAAGHEVSARVGAEVLARGGGACDAVVAAALASWAAEPTMTGPGGGGFLLYRDARSGRTTLLDFFVAVPGLGPHGASTPMEAFDIEFGEASQTFRYGAASIAVPGSPKGLGEAHRRWGTLPWAQLVAPAIEIADRGVPLSAQHAVVHRYLQPLLTHMPEGREVFCVEDRLVDTGEVVRQPRLARTLERIAELGPEDVYTGILGGLVADEVHAHGGALSREDLAAYRVISRRPVAVTARGFRIATNAPPSSGGVLLGYSLALRDRLEPVADPLSVQAVRHAVALLREAEARRTPAFERRLHRGGARSILDPESVAAGARGVREALASGTRLAPPVIGARGTTHISVIDRHGNAASMTCSLGCGSGIFIGDTGLHLNNMLGEEDLTSAARLVPGARLTSMMSPSLLVGPDGAEVVVGSSGSARIRSALHRVITAVAEHGLSAQEAVDLPRIHPSGPVLDCEPGFSAETLDRLEELGEPVVRWPDLNVYFGGAQVVTRRGDRFEAAGDPRRGGAGIVIEG